MPESTEQRAYLLIEELRADIDFELDDVLHQIVRDLPEEYFQRLQRDDQLTHLKALLALNICQLKEEIFMPSEDGRFVAVVGRQNYTGLLASILKRLPKDDPLIGAKIFTSTKNDFIIDLFEYDADTSASDQDSFDSYAIEKTKEKVVQEVGCDRSVLDAFVQHYPNSSPVLTNASELRDHFNAYQAIDDRNGLAVQSRDSGIEGRLKLIVATRDVNARKVVLQAAEYMASQKISIEQAFLNDLHVSGQPKTSICSFRVVSENNGDTAETLTTGIQGFFESEPG